MKTLHECSPPSGKLFELETPQEMHRRLVWGGEVCSLDGKAPVSLSCIIYLPEDVLRETDPAGFFSGNYQKCRAFDFAKMGGVYYKYTEMFGCIRCEKALEKIVATSQHSAAYVQWDRGVAADRLVIGVAAGGLQ